MGDLLFPGSVMLLKFIFKLLIEQEVRLSDALKALLNFPLDLAFLAFSFGAAILYSMPASAPALQVATMKAILGSMIAAIVVLSILAMMCRKSDKAFTGERLLSAFAIGVSSYAVSLLTVYLALNIKGIVI